MNVITKRPIGKQDINFWDGVNETFNQMTEDGIPVSLSRVGSVVDVLAAYGHNVTRTATVINNAITAIGSAACRLEFAPGVWNIDVNVTIPSNMPSPVFHPGAVFNIASGVTVTMPIPEAGRYQIFSGNGNVSFTNSDLVKVEWFGAVNNDTVDCSPAFQKAIASIAGVGGGISLGKGIYKMASGITIPVGVSVYGSGVRQIFKGQSQIGSVIHFVGSDTLFMASQTWENQKFVNFAVNVDDNVNSTAVVMDANYGQNYCDHDYVIYRGSNTTLGPLVYLRGQTVGGTPNSALFFNRISIRIHSNNPLAASSGPAIVVGSDVFNCRANANLFDRCYVAGYEIGIQVSGHSNIFSLCNFQQNPVAGIHFVIEAGGGNIHSNVITACYFDVFTTGKPVKVSNYHASDICAFDIVGGSSGLTNINPLPVEVVNYGDGKATYNVYSNFIRLGGVVDSSFVRESKTPMIENALPDGFLRIYGGPNSSNTAEWGGAIYLCGHQVADTNNSVGAGNLVMILNSALANSALRVSSTSDYVNYTKLLEITNAGALRGLKSTNGPVGTFALSNGGGTTTTVANTAVTANSIIIFTPTSAAAAAAVGSASGVYVSGITPGVSFTVTHPASPGVGATLNYLILN